MKEALFSKTILLLRFRATSLIIFFIPLFIVIQINAVEQKEHAGVEIAFLEDWCRREFDGTEVKNKYESRVRLAFILTPDGWKAFDHRVSGREELRQAANRFSGNRSWFLLERDRPQDSLLSRGIKEYQWYADIGIQSIAGQLPASALLPRTMEFAGWIYCKVRKPIVLVSRTPQKSKDNWMRIEPTFTPNNEMVDLINTFGNELYTCRNERDERGVYLRAEIKSNMLNSVEELVSEKGDRLFAVRFRDNACVIGNSGDKVSALYWFSQVEKSPIMFIGEGLKLIDWADYDADGNSEFLFWLNGYNSNGYIILWNKQSRTATFSWKYH